MMSLFRLRLAVPLFAIGLLVPAVGAQPESFAARVAALSEPGGYFDTDNLISNEQSFLHVVPALRAPALQGGVYLGVGPDQNFSYIAHLRPSLAILVDIRRDNLLLHLLFKALFAEAATRAEYLALLTGRSPPAPQADWAARPIEDIVAYVDQQRPRPSAELASIESRLAGVVTGFGVPLSDEDHRTMRRFHRRFVADGLSLQFNSAGRPPQYDYPTYRDLILETDRSGARRSFLASESDFQFVKSLQARDLVIPVVGDLSGSTALAAIARFLATRGERVSAVYASNVEFYLFRQGTFGRFIANLQQLPLRDEALVIRSVFGRSGLAPPGYNSASVTQPIRALLEGYEQGRFRRYAEVVAGSR
jgi:hypothetical protein